jgi:hypothetical protein
VRKTRVRKTEYVGLFVEPDLRATIEGEARRRNQKISRVVRAMLRDQLATLSHRSSGSPAASS